MKLGLETILWRRSVGGRGVTPYQLLRAQVCQEASQAPSSEPLSLHPSPRPGVTGALILTLLLCPEHLATGTQCVGGGGV